MNRSNQMKCSNSMVQCHAFAILWIVTSLFHWCLTITINYIHYVYLQAHTFQAILVAQGSTTYLINNYCSDNEESGEEYPRFAVADGDSHVVVLKERNTLSAVRPSFVLGQEDTPREGQYVLRFDALHCFNQDEFYCLKGEHTCTSWYIFSVCGVVSCSVLYSNLDGIHFFSLFCRPT